MKKKLKFIDIINKLVLVFSRLQIQYQWPFIDNSIVYALLSRCYYEWNPIQPSRRKAVTHGANF
jgi:hypothetical protein